MSTNLNVYHYSPSYVSSKLDQSIDFLNQNIGCYCNDPTKDFTRKRKWSIHSIIHFLMNMESKSMKSELVNYFDSSNVPTDSSLSQQRDKLQSEAIKRVMHLFTSNFHLSKTMKGYYLLAADGSDINIAYDSTDEDTKANNGSNFYSKFHLNALYDCLNHVYRDVSIDSASKTREQASLKKLIQSKSYPIKSIIICDRGYEGYDLIACCIENGQKFLIRVKDINSYSSILKNIDLPDGEFDIHVKRIMTRKQSKEVRENKDIYVPIMNSMEFSYLPIEEDY